MSSAQIISERGYPEHVIGGAILSGTVSYLVYKKTDCKFRAFAIGLGASIVAGAGKELLDPLIFNGTRNPNDFWYTALGGTVGASIVFPLNKNKKTAVSFGSHNGNKWITWDR